MTIRFDDWEGQFLKHYGIKGQKWGVKNGPPYPLNEITLAKIRMKSVHELYGGGTVRDNARRFKHGKETFESLKKIVKGSSIEQIRHDINHADEGVYFDVGREYNCPFCAASTIISTVSILLKIKVKAVCLSAAV